MQKFLLVLGVGFCLAWTGAIGSAQEIPKVQISGGISYLRFHASAAEATDLSSQLGVPVQTNNVSSNLFGWNSSVTENLNSWFAGELDLSGFYGSPVASFLSPATTPLNLSQHVPVLAAVHSFMYGPRFSYRKKGRFVPYAHILLGGAHFNGTINQSSVLTASPLASVASGTRVSDTAFAAAPGGGLEISVNSRFAVRPVQIDYLMTRFYAQRQDNLRFSAGIVFNLGTK
jgi:opacity protein-like surface antigen